MTYHAHMKTDKQRKNLLLSRSAVSRGERAARELNLSLSGLIEKHLLSLPGRGEEEDYWPETLRPVARRGEKRFDYLRDKHA
jgi:hypothetical protein